MTASIGPDPEDGDSRQPPVGDAPNLLTRLRRDALRALATGSLYRHTLIGQAPADLQLRIGQRWPGDAARGAEIAAGRIELAGALVREPSPRWFPPAAGEEWLAAWHGFDWLADVAAAGGAAREQARTLVQSWIEENGAWQEVSWRSDVLASRVFAWITHFDEIVERGGDEALRRTVLASLVGQLRHLARTASWERAGAPRVRALKGLIAGTAALGGPPARTAKAVRALAREMPVQILPDGGHRSRSPSLQLQVLLDLVDVRAVLRAARFEVPAAVHEAIGRMAPMLRFFRHGDLRLALFNDSLEGDGVLIDLVLTQSEIRTAAPLRAPSSGFDRLPAGRTLVVIDTGKPAPHGFDHHAHAGTLSFEMSHERERIVVNCGAYRGPKANWSRVARASAAHSVLVVDDTNSVEIRPDGTLGPGPGTVSCERAEHEGKQWIAASHDGYRDRFGLVYARQLFLAADGEDLRGEDRLTGRPGASFAVRFHLHPSVQASLDHAAGAAALRLPSGAVWRLRAAGAEISLGESIYLGAGDVRRTQQIVLSGTTAGETTVIRWAIRRESRRTGDD